MTEEEENRFAWQLYLNAENRDRFRFGACVVVLTGLVFALVVGGLVYGLLTVAGRLAGK